MHLLGRFDATRGGLHARTVGFGGHQAAQHFGRLDGQQDLGARLQDLVLLGREQQRHQVQHQVAGIQRRDGGGVARQRGRAQVGQRVAADGFFGVDGRQVQPVDARAQVSGGGDRAAQCLRMRVGAGQHGDDLPGFKP
ncbi:hypothetical protein D3C87_1447530 [compost metagenome]